MNNNLKEYVDIKETKTRYSAVDMVAICKRINNKKRDFLFVNRFQGKHVPISPTVAFTVFGELVDEILKKIDPNEKIVVIGFAETATAIGNYVALHLPNCIYHMQTTREKIENEKPFIEFKEEHSHAPEQLLYGDIDKIVECDRILFVEDEISTGKTILNFVNEIKKFSTKFKFAVASILNWQDEGWSQKFNEDNIDTYCLIKGEIKDINFKVTADVKDGEHVCKNNKMPSCFEIESKLCNFEKERLGSVPYDINVYKKHILEVTEQFLPEKREREDIVVIGTEEFMFIPMLFAKVLEESNYGNVFFHATSRSPIVVSDGKNYVLEKRYQLRSAYDSNRTTYIYNLKKYDKVFIVTDCKPSKEFVEDITSALYSCGCKIQNIQILIWK